MEKNNYLKKPVTLAHGLRTLEDLHSLQKIGAGHDGVVYRYGDKAIKELKYDIKTRKTLSLMTFEKAQYFADWSSKFKRIIVPQDILLDEDGIYCAYVMDYINKVDFKDYSFDKVSLETFLNTIYELWDDFKILNAMQIVAKDINAGSYLFDDKFLHLCDTDKYLMKNYDPTTMNLEKYNYAIAKLLYLLMYNKELGKENLKKLNAWVKHQANNNDFLGELTNEFIPISNDNLCEYTTSLKRKLLK